jgi:hypothetical protein
VLEAVDVVTQVVEDARPLLLRAIELADQVRPLGYDLLTIGVSVKRHHWSHLQIAYVVS